MKKHKMQKTILRLDQKKLIHLNKELAEQRKKELNEFNKKKRRGEIPEEEKFKGVKKLSLEEIHLLTWIAQFITSGSMIEHEIDGKIYYQLSKGYVVKQLAFYINNEKKVWRLMQNLIFAGLLEKEMINAGARNYIAVLLTDKFYELIGDDYKTAFKQ